MSETSTSASPDAICASASEFYVVNLSHGHREHRYVTLWRPYDKGYAWPLPWAGRYPRARILESPDYYNDGANIAVPCEIVEQLAITPEPGQIDGDVGPVVPNDAHAWGVLLAHKIGSTKYKLKPVLWGSRRRRERRVE